jgi:hypothetical protein
LLLITHSPRGPSVRDKTLPQDLKMRYVGAGGVSLDAVKITPSSFVIMVIS